MNALNRAESFHLQNTPNSRWFFYPTPAGWRWDHVALDGALIAQAAGAFPSRTACVSDAKANGYAPQADEAIARPRRTRPNLSTRTG